MATSPAQKERRLQCIDRAIRMGADRGRDVDQLIEDAGKLEDYLENGVKQDD